MSTKPYSTTFLALRFSATHFVCWLGEALIFVVCCCELFRRNVFLERSCVVRPGVFQHFLVVRFLAFYSISVQFCALVHLKGLKVLCILACFDTSSRFWALWLLGFVWKRSGLFVDFGLGGSASDHDMKEPEWPQGPLSAVFDLLMDMLTWRSQCCSFWFESLLCACQNMATSNDKCSRNEKNMVCFCLSYVSCLTLAGIFFGVLLLVASLGGASRILWGVMWAEGIVRRFVPFVWLVVAFAGWCAKKYGVEGEQKARQNQAKAATHICLILQVTLMRRFLNIDLWAKGPHLSSHPIHMISSRSMERVCWTNRLQFAAR